MKKYLGIELGSTRIKAVLIGENYASIASGAHEWENKLEAGVWTYHLDDVWTGIQAAFRELATEYQSVYHEPLRHISGLGISAMMHGYLVFDQTGNQLVPFRTWRNTTTEQAAKILTETFDFNIPQRWSIAHLYQAVLNEETHIKEIAFMTTLSGYVHWKLTGQKVLGVGEASGVFPIDSTANQYDSKMIESFNALVDFDLQTILPTVLNAGDDGGTLTVEGARYLDPKGILQAGVPLCPPEGDAGTGMVATNSIAPRTGNVSAGTSVFAMIVLERALSKVYTEIDMVTTPDGMPVAMVHCNSCTSDIDAWVNLFGEALTTMNMPFDKNDLYKNLYQKALEGDADGGGLLAYNYYSGEPITELDEGRPLFVRLPNAKMNLANFMRTQLYASMATLKLGMDILIQKEQVQLEKLLGHGGLFKTKHVGQQMMANALQIPITVMDSAGEGGAWGIAVLAAYAVTKGEASLNTFLQRVFEQQNCVSVAPILKEVEGFERFMQRYTSGIAIEKVAVEVLK